MIKFNWSRKSDGTELTKISVTFTLSRDQLANLLVAALLPSMADELVDMSKAAIEREIRSQLAHNPSKMDYWPDNYPDSESLSGEWVSYAQVEEWARHQIDKLP